MICGNLEHKVRRTDDLTSQKANIKTSHKVLKIIFKRLFSSSWVSDHSFKHFTEDFLSFCDSSLTVGSSLSLRPGIQNCTKLNKFKAKSLCLALPPCDIFVQQSRSVQYSWKTLSSSHVFVHRLYHSWCVLAIFYHFVP